MSNWPRQTQCRIIPENGALVVLTPYIPLLVQSIKSLPFSERKYDPARKAWLVDPRHGQTVADWIEAYAGEKVSSPFLQAGVKPITGTHILRLRYLGGCKEREDGSVSAFALVGQEWAVIFPERVLREWFEGIDVISSSSAQQAKGPLTYYSILGLKKDVDTEKIRAGFRRMALQWHPDHCHEPDAGERFIRIKTAYDCLIDPDKRARYDMGLRLQAKVDAEQRLTVKTESNIDQYRAPLRCGLVMVKGIERLGRTEVSKIYAWEDITQDGKTLVSSWTKGDTEPTEEWV